MRLFVIGATGRIGREIIDVGLARGHEVTAFVRSPQKVAPRERLRVVAGDPRSTSALTEAMGEHDAVLSTIGPRLPDIVRPNTLLTDIAASTVAAMTTTGIARLGIVSAALLFDLKGLQIAFFRWLANHHVRDLRTMEAIVTSSGLSWTIARPPRLVETRQEAYRAEADVLPAGSLETSFRSVGVFLLDALERRTHIGQIVGVTK
jgi:putative NADH-flavin reductase